MHKRELRYWLASIYVVLTVAWVIIIWMFGFLYMGLVAYLICLLPIVTFVISFYFADSVDEATSVDVVSSGFLSFCLLIVAVLANWNSKLVEEKTIFFQIVAVGVVIVMLSMIEVSVPPKYYDVLHYYRSGLRTIAFTLFIMALYKYYVVHTYVNVNQKSNLSIGFM